MKKITNQTNLKKEYHLKEKRKVQKVNYRLSKLKKIKLSQMKNKISNKKKNMK